MIFSPTRKLSKLYYFCSYKYPNRIFMLNWKIPHQQLTFCFICNSFSLFLLCLVISSVRVGSLTKCLVIVWENQTVVRPASWQSSGQYWSWNFALLMIIFNSACICHRHICHIHVTDSQQDVPDKYKDICSLHCNIETSGA